MSSGTGGNNKNDGRAAYAAAARRASDAMRRIDEAIAKAQGAGDTGAADYLQQVRRREHAEELHSIGTGILDAAKLAHAGGRNDAVVDSLLDMAARILPGARVGLTGSSALFTRLTPEQVRQDVERAAQVIPLPYPVEIVDDDGTPGLAIPQGGITVIAGATGHGKTTLLIDMAARLVNARRRVLYLTNEQSAGTIYARLANWGGKTLDRVASNPGITVNECTQYDSGRLLASIAAGLRYEEKRPAVIIIDWLQMIPGTDADKAGGAEWYRLRDLMAGLNAVALETGTAIITAAQFNRQVVNPARVGLSSMGDSVGISQLAGKVLGIWNCSKQAQWGAKGAFDAEKTPGHLRRVIPICGRAGTPAYICGYSKNGTAGG